MGRKTWKPRSQGLIRELGGTSVEFGEKKNLCVCAYLYIRSIYRYIAYVEINRFVRYIKSNGYIKYIDKDLYIKFYIYINLYYVCVYHIYHIYSVYTYIIKCLFRGNYAILK